MYLLSFLSLLTTKSCYKSEKLNFVQVHKHILTCSLIF